MIFICLFFLFYYYFSPLRMSLFFSSPSPSTLPSSLSSLFLRQKINPEYPKTYTQNLLKPPLQFLSFTQNTRPKSTDPIEEKEENHQNRIAMKSNPMKVKTSSSKFWDLMQELTSQLKLESNHSKHHQLIFLSQTNSNPTIQSTISADMRGDLGARERPEMGNARGIYVREREEREKKRK